MGNRSSSTQSGRRPPDISESGIDPQGKQWSWSEAVVHLPQHAPQDLVDSLRASLEELRLDGPLFNGKRDQFWTDLIDPELCLTHVNSEPYGADSPEFMRRAKPSSTSAWRASEAVVDASGHVRWSSWVNHLSRSIPHHLRIQAGLARLLELALPHLERVAHRQLRGRTLHVIVGAFEHQMTHADSARISDWHIDGTPQEDIVATATTYLEVSGGLQGGLVDFALQTDMRNENPQQMHSVQPASASMLVFNNAALRHRVRPVSGSGRRLLVALHLVDPQGTGQPVGPEPLLRQLRPQHSAETLRALTLCLNRAHPALQVPRDLLLHICGYAARGLRVSELQARRDLSRVRRLYPGSGGGYSEGTGTEGSWMSGTGSSYADEGPVIGGTGLAEHMPGGGYQQRSWDE